MTTDKNEWYVIVNPHAGSGKTMSKWTIAEARLKELSIGYVCVLTERKFHAVELAEAAAAKGYRKFLPVGGDGSLHEVLKGIMRYCDSTGTSPSEFFLSMIPIGSGNDWVRSLGNTHDVLKSVDMLRNGRCCRQDVIRLRDSKGEVSYMVNTGGFGFDSDVCLRVNSQKEQGLRSRLIYIAAIVYTVTHMKSFHACMKADGETFYDGEAFSVSIGNGHYSGGGLRLASMALIDDGMMDIMIIPKISLLRIAFEIRRVFFGTIHKCGAIVYKRCRTLEITTDPCLNYELDGEVETELPVSLEVVEEQINVLRQA